MYVMRPTFDTGALHRHIEYRITGEEFRASYAYTYSCTILPAWMKYFVYGVQDPLANIQKSGDKTRRTAPGFEGPSHPLTSGGREPAADVNRGDLATAGSSSNTGSVDVETEGKGSMSMAATAAAAFDGVGEADDEDEVGPGFSPLAGGAQ